MLANQQILIRVSKDDKKMLETLAKHFQRSKSDTIRTAIRGLYRVVQAEAKSNPPAA